MKAVIAALIVFAVAAIAAPQIERHPENTAANKQRKSSATVVAEAKKAAADSRKAANAAQNVPALRQAVADLAATVSNLCQVVEALTSSSK
jgi:ubiquinone biosynthesis protein UbiJ